MSKEADGSSCREDYADDKGWTIVVESESLKVGKSIKIGKIGTMGIQLLLDFLKSDSTALAMYYVSAKLSIFLSCCQIVSLHSWC